MYERAQDKIGKSWRRTLLWIRW